MANFSILKGLWAVLVLIFGVLHTIITPLLYDSLNPTSSSWIPESGINDSSMVNLTSSLETRRRIDPIFSITVSMAFDVVVLGIGLLFIKCLSPGKISENDRNYPKRYFLMVGGFQAVLAVLWQYSAPGERVAPYLQPILTAANVPAVFIIRY